MRNKRSDDMSRNHHLITRNIDAEWDGYNEWRERAMNKSFLDYWEVLDIRTEIRLVCLTKILVIYVKVIFCF